MLTSLNIENYRRFKRYRLAGLSRVNLLVGKNNCGKTSVLEAVHLLRSGGDPSVLARIAAQRGELTFTDEYGEPYRDGPLPVVSHFFHGHGIEGGSYLRLCGNDGADEVRVEVVDRYQQPKPYDPGVNTESPLALAIEGLAYSGMAGPREIDIFEDGALDPKHISRLRSSPVRAGRANGQPAQFLSLDLLKTRRLAKAWDTALQEGREGHVVEALRILDRRLANVYFLSGEEVRHSGGVAGILVELDGAREREPLGSQGDGMAWLLALAIALTQSDGGPLLVDEIDTALHYSIMGDMWRLVVETARRYNVQVFATTHSHDCVRGLAWFCENHPELGTEVSLQKLDPGTEEAVALDAEQILIAQEQRMEVR